MSVIKVRVWCGSRYVDLEDGAGLALPSADIMRQLAEGRTYGSFPINGGQYQIPYADVTSVEMTWTK